MLALIGLMPVLHLSRWVRTVVFRANNAELRFRPAPECKGILAQPHERNLHVAHVHPDGVGEVRLVSTKITD